MSIPNAIRSVNRKLATALNVRAELLREDIYGVLEEHKVGSGVHWPGNKNPSSSQGEPPARQTGKLQESISVLKRAAPGDLVSEVGPAPEAFQADPYYPVFLEFGTRRGLEARPFMRPAVERFKRTVKGRVR